MIDDSKIKRLFLPGLIVLVVCLFWSIVMPPKEPAYDPGETEAFGAMTWSNIWFWTDLGGYHRYSPTAYFPIGVIDAHFFAPLNGIKFPSEEFRFGSRFIPYYIFMIGLVSCLTYFLAKRLSLDTLSALIAALYLGLHKGWYWGFGFMSIIAVIPLLLIYGTVILLFWIKYLRTRKRAYLAGFIVSFLLIIGAWEQWINFMFFFVFFNLLLLLVPKASSALIGDTIKDGGTWKVGFHRVIPIFGIVLPLLFFSIYISVRFSTIQSQMSASTGEDAMAFSYLRSLGNSPGVWKLILEDMLVNSTLHIASTIESLIFPWKMLSQAVIYQFDIDLFNPVHSSFSNVDHYLSLTDWYSGLLSGFFFCVTIWIIFYLRTNGSGRDVFISGAGLLLTYTGFLVHLPIAYRSYFAASDYAGLLDYKHMFSVLGFSLLVGWGWEKVMLKIKKPQHKFFMTVVIAVWLIFTNFCKVY